MTLTVDALAGTVALRPVKDGTATAAEEVTVAIDEKSVRRHFGCRSSRSREDGKDGHGCTRELRYDAEDVDVGDGYENGGEDDVSVYEENTVMVNTVFGVEEEVPPPTLGMVFGSWDKLDTYFWSYGRQKGFGIVRAASRWVDVKKDLEKGKCCKQRRNAKWTCDCYGNATRKRKQDALKEGLDIRALALKE
uniref:FAR1 domain-containing protein n=1 Tax=Chenopodium quinoa TaxID=63459 RepID=A0A803LIR4_CHEQI